MRAYRSPTRLFAFGLLGLLLIVASVDVMFAHWVSTVPENTDGVLTTRGQAQQRGDIVWGAVMLGTGTLLFAGALVELVRRQPQCVISAGGIEAPIGSHGDIVTVQWSNVSGVRGELIEDPFDGSRRAHLVVDVVDSDELPHELRGARWNGNELQIDAQEWTKGVSEYAIAAQGALGHYRRMDEIRHMEAPSLTWRTSVAAAEDGAIQTAAGGDIELETDEMQSADDPVSADAVDGVEEIEPESAFEDIEPDGLDERDPTDPEEASK